MHDEQEIFELLDTLKGSTSPSDSVELIFIASLMRYLEEDEAYSNLFTIHSLLEVEDELVSRLDDMLDQIEEDIPYFKDVFTQLPALHNLDVMAFTKVLYAIKSVNIKSIGYDKWCQQLIEQFENSLFSGGAHTSPASLNQLAINILRPKQGSFYDGTFGFGGGAMTALKFAQENDGHLNVWGQEINHRVYALAKIRFFLCGEANLTLKKGDMFVNPGFVDQRQLKTFDHIYMDIPKSYRTQFDFKGDPYHRFVYGNPSERSAEFGFISHMLASLKETGRAITVVSSGTLFKGGINGTIRKNMIDDNIIEAVIALPSGLYEGTGIPVNILVFNKNKPKETKDQILFINAHDLYTEDGRSKRYISVDDINKIVEVVQAGREIEEFSTYVQNNDLIDGNLLPSRYVTSSQMAIAGYGQVTFHLDRLKHLKTTPLKSKVELFSGYNVSSKNKESENGRFKIVRLSDVHDGKLHDESIARYNIENNARIERYVLQKDDVILSTRGTTIKVAIVPAHEGVMLLSQNFIGIRCDEQLNPAFLKAYLESPVGTFILTNKLSGTAIPTLRRKDIEAIEIPDIPMSKQESMMSGFLQKEQWIEAEMKRLQRELEDAKRTVLDEMGVSGVYEVRKE